MPKDERTVEEIGQKRNDVLSRVHPPGRQPDLILGAKERCRLLFETMLQGVVYQDADGTIISMNPAAERILGKAPSEFLGSSSVGEAHDTIREDGRPFAGPEHPAMVALRTGREVRDVVMGVYNPRMADYRWINITAVPLFQSGQNKPHQVYAIFDDITDRKKAESALGRSEEQLRLAVEAASLVSFDWDIQRNEVRRFVSNEPALATVLKEKPRTFEDMREIVHPEDRERFTCNIHTAMERADGQYESEFRILRAEGGVAWFHERGVVQRDADGRPARLIGLSQDVTARKRSEEMLRNLNALLETKIGERTAELEDRTLQLQKLTQALSEVEDRERKRLAEILHDDLQQQLAGAKFHVGILAKSVKENVQIYDMATQIKQMLQDAIETSRNLSHELSPPPCCIRPTWRIRLTGWAIRWR